MNPRAAIERAVAEVLGDRRVSSVTPLSGGCIHHVSRIELSDGSSLVAKVGSPTRDAELFKAETAGLEALGATNAVLVPQPVGLVILDDASILLMSCVQPAPASPRAWRRLGEDLAALHGSDVGARYGWGSDNFLGSTPQPNRWMDDWVEFNRECRLGHQVTLARAKGLLNASEARELEGLMARLDRFIPRRSKPALLHGDLWSGNALPTAGERIAVIDPAVSIGDGWADIAMMKLFGGFHSGTFEAYGDAIVDHDQVAERLAIYQLYHLINHVNIFGRGYARQAMGIVRSLA